MSFPGGSINRESTCKAGRPGFDSWVRKIPCRREWQPAPAFLPRESRGAWQAWGRKRIGHDPAAQPTIIAFQRAIRFCPRRDSAISTRVPPPSGTSATHPALRHRAGVYSKWQVSEVVGLDWVCSAKLGPHIPELNFLRRFRLSWATGNILHEVCEA